MCVRHRARRAYAELGSFSGRTVVTLKWVVRDPEPEPRMKVVPRRFESQACVFHAYATTTTGSGIAIVQP